MAQFVEAPLCRLEGRGFDSRWGPLGIFIDVILPSVF